jgi:hypothetical protein
LVLGGTRLARAAWLAALLVGLGLMALSFAQQVAQIQSECASGPCSFVQLTPRQAQELAGLHLPLTALGAYFLSITLLRVLIFVLIGAVLIWRRADDRLALYAAFMLMLFGVGSGLDFSAAADPRLQFAAWLYQAAGNSSLAVFFFIFPDGRFIPRWTRWLALAVVAREILEVFANSPIVLALFFVAAPIAMGIQIYRYRRVSNTIQRQQTKWVVYGSLLGLSIYMGLLLFLDAASAQPDSLGLLAIIVIGTGLSLALTLVPISLAIAILRARLWDIDLLIRRTLVYGALTALLAGVYLGAVVALQALFVAVSGTARSQFVTVLSTLAIAALFVPLRARLQRFIDRRFYRRKYDAARTLAEFSASLRDEVDLEQLSGRLVRVVDETMQPAQVSLWLERPGGGHGNRI